MQVVPWPLAGSARCALATLAMGAVPFAVALMGRRGSDPTHPRAAGAALGVVAGAWAAVLIDLHCEHADGMHVALGHVGPVVILALVGLVVGGGWLAVRGRATESRGARG
jgi:hypothetical protein